MSDKFIDDLAAKTGIDITFFCGDKRLVTSLKDANGERILDSAAGEFLVKNVLTDGNDVFTNRLAEQSSEATKETTGVIEQLLVNSNNTMSIMNDVTNVIVHQDEHVRRTVDAFNKDKNEVDGSLVYISSISEKMKQLGEIRQQIGSVLENLSAVAE